MRGRCVESWSLEVMVKLWVVLELIVKLDVESWSLDLVVELVELAVVGIGWLVIVELSRCES